MAVICRALLLLLLMLTGAPGRCQTHAVFLIAAAAPDSVFSATALHRSPPSTQCLAAFHPTDSLLVIQEQTATHTSFYTIAGKGHTPVKTLSAPERALALQVTPGGKSIAWMSAAAGSTSIRTAPLAGGPPRTLVTGGQLENFMLMDDNTLLTTSAGDPNQLMLQTIRPKRSIPVARHVGNVLAPVPPGRGYAFVHKLSVDSWSIKVIGPDGKINILTETLPDAEVFAIDAASRVWMLYEGTLMVRPASGRPEWTPARISGISGKIRHLVGSRDGRRLIVISELP